MQARKRKSGAQFPKSEMFLPYLIPTHSSRVLEGKPEPLLGESSQSPTDASISIYSDTPPAFVTCSKSFVEQDRFNVKTYSSKSLNATCSNLWHCPIKLPSIGLYLSHVGLS